MAQRSNKSDEIEIVRVKNGEFDACLLGRTPLILNRMSDKAMRQLLQPKMKKNRAEKESTAKHHPLEEFRGSAYQDKDEKSPALLQHVSSAFKGALASAALDLPGANKSQISRLTWVNGERVHIFGKPKIFCAITRSADMNKTPDVRTRVIVPEWACRITVAFVTPILKQVGVANLLASAGVTQGVGDWRTGKGKGTYGGFDLVDESDEEWRRRMTVGRDVQVAAMKDPEPYDDDTEELLIWWEREMKSRGFTDEVVDTMMGDPTIAAPAKKRRGASNGARA